LGISERVLYASTRVRAAGFYRHCHNDASLKLMAFEKALTDQAVALFETRADKDWGITDCMSFVVMQNHRLNDALTADKHFEQAGFRALLREAPPNQ
jgi:uncharacterized protein